MSPPWVAAFVALSVVVVVVALVVLGVLRRVATVLELVESRLKSSQPPTGGAQPGTAVSPFEVRDRAGKFVHSTELLSSDAVVLFLSADCEPCRPLVEDLLQSEWTTDVRLVAILGDSLTNRAMSFSPSVHVFYQSNRNAAKAFQSNATPQAFAIGAGGIVIRNSIPQTLNDLRHLAESAKGGDEAVRSRPLETVNA